ncbi:MAG: protease inhibitor I42 family protein [Planctomycetes bacterium]|nr:protease inhibitor I42 family protein [Planctomycetota bacterium]
MRVAGYGMVAVVFVVMSFARAEIPEKLLKLAEKDSGKTVKVGLGDAIEVVLKCNPTTGYAWTIASIDKAILKPVDKEEYKPDSRAIGAGGKMTMRFRAVGKGETTLKLIYHRPWEKNKPAARTFEVKVVVPPL